MQQFIKLKRLNKNWLIVYLFVKVFLSQILLAQSLLWKIAIIGKESVGMTDVVIIKFYFLFDNYISFLFKVFILQVFINNGPSMSSMICVFTYPLCWPFPCQNLLSGRSFLFSSRRSLQQMIKYIHCIRCIFFKRLVAKKYLHLATI